LGALAGQIAHVCYKIGLTPRLIRLVRPNVPNAAHLLHSLHLNA